MHKIVRLNPLWKTEEITDVLTSDGVPLTIKLGVGYQIEPLRDTIERLEKELPGKQGYALEQLAGLIGDLRAEREEIVIGGDYPVWRENVRKAAMNVTPAGWEILAVAGAESQLRDTVATYRFDQIFRPVEFNENGGLPAKFEEDERSIQEIEEYVMEKWGPIGAEHYGFKIRAIDIQGMKLPDQVYAHLIEWWGLHWSQMAHFRRREPELRVNQLERDLKLAQAGTEAKVRRIEGIGQRHFLVEEATGKARAKSLEGRGERRYLLEKAEARREVSAIDIDTAQAKAAARGIEAEAEKQALIQRGEGEAVARTKQFRAMLGLLRELLDDRDAMLDIIRMLCESIAKSEDRRLFIATLRDTRMRGTLLPGDIAGSMDTSKWSFEGASTEAESKTNQ